MTAMAGMDGMTRPAAHSGHAGFARGGAVDNAHQRLRPEPDRARLRRREGLDAEDGRTLREWHLIATDKEIEIAPGVKYAAWTFNDRVPGPTLRCTEGDHLRIKFTNGSAHPHTVHFHGIHPSTMDGVPGLGEEIGGGLIQPGQSFTYEFDAEPFGLHLYHCHATPLAAHIAKGLYGTFIVDPKEPRPQADELVMVMNAFDTNFDFGNEVYAVNTVGFHYLNYPIKVKRDQLVRIYLVNVLEYDPINSFHVHANFFHYFPTGTSLAAGRVHRHDQPGAGAARDPRAALPVHGQVHVPRPQDRVRRARLDGLLRGRGLMAAEAGSRRAAGEQRAAVAARPRPARAHGARSSSPSPCSARRASASGAGRPSRTSWSTRSRSTPA